MPLDPRRDFVEAARHEELEVVKPLKAALVDEVPYCFGGGRLKDPENLVPRVEVEKDFWLDLVLLQHWL